MNRNHYKFVFLIIILIVLLYNIVIHKYKQYKIEEYKNTIISLNAEIKNNIELAKEIISYKKSLAFKNKILKQDKWLKNKAEKVVYITTEDKYNKYISKPQKISNVKNKKIITDDNTFWMTVYQKWIWLIFKKDLR